VTIGTALGIGNKLTVKLNSGSTAAYASATNDFVSGTTGSVFVQEFGASSGNTYSTLGSLTGGGAAWGNVLLAPAGNVSINSTTFNNTLTVNGTLAVGGTAAQVGSETLQLQGAGAGARFYDRAAGSATSWVAYNNSDTFRLYSNSAAADRLTINASGNTTISGTLSVSGGDIYSYSGSNFTRVHHNGTAGYIDTNTVQLYLRPSSGGGLTATVDSGSGFTASKVGATSATALCQDGLGFLRNCTPSSARYKNTITDMQGGLSTLRQLRPVNYYYNQGVSDDQEGVLQVGFIAEEVAAVGGASYVLYNQQGQIETLQYDKVTVLNSLALIELDVQVQANQARLDVVEAGQFSGNLTVAGNTELAGTLTVTGMTQLTGLKVTGLTEVADLKVNGKIITAGVTPTAVLGANTTVGQSSTVAVTGNDTAGYVSYTSGAVNLPSFDLATGAQLTTTFATPFTTAPRIALTAKDATSAAVRYYAETTTTGFTIHFIDAPSATTTYTFDYIVIQ
jgi:hypothetical protein